MDHEEDSKLIVDTEDLNQHPGGIASRLSQHDQDKKEKILAACKIADVQQLRELALSAGGLLSDDARQEAWPLLLGQRVARSQTCGPKADSKEDWRQLPVHDDEHQVHLDVNRSFIYYPNDQSHHQTTVRKEELSDLIIEVLRRHCFLSYFQGYHDICQVLLLVLRPQDRATAVARLSLLRIRDFMLPSLQSVQAQLSLIPTIIYAVHPRLYYHLSQTKPDFALANTLTMYAHNIESYGEISRLFDVLLAREAVFAVYMFAQIVLQRERELFETPADEPDMLYFILLKLPRPLDLEELISKTVMLIERHPPEKLNNWSSISQFSVLKTAHNANQVISQSTEDGKMFFVRQVEEQEKAEKRKLRKKMFRGALRRCRKPVARIGMAVIIAMLAYWLKMDSRSLRGIGSFWNMSFGNWQ